MTSPRSLLALDVGEKRIGVALADMQIKIAIAYDTLQVDGTEAEAIKEIVAREKIEAIVVGYPRNQSGAPTAQTKYVEKYIDQLAFDQVPVYFQDESLTSVRAEELLKSQKKPYSKADIDALAASLILQDYLEGQHGRI